MAAAPGSHDDWQRLDVWLWSARFLKSRADCARLAEQGMLRLNRQPTDKAHARLRVGDVITLPLRGRVMVLEVLALASRRGPASEARLLYRELSESSNAVLRPHTCGSDETTAYPRNLTLSSTRSPR
jgi:ribosome-associated heat shock protein Hsp15